MEDNKSTVSEQNKPENEAVKLENKFKSNVNHK